MGWTLFLSNGHGEDVCGAAIAVRLREIAPERELRAFPVVGTGVAYQEAGIDVVGPHRNLPHGGHIYGRPAAIIKEVVCGLPILLWQQLRFLKKVAAQVDEIVAVGDIVPLLMNRWQLKKPLYYLAISKSAYYRGGAPPIIDLPEFWALKNYARVVFLRDRFTWEEARKQYPQMDLRFVGNPMMDTFSVQGPGFPLLSRPAISLLPGSRESAFANMEILLEVAAAIRELTPGASFLVSRAPHLAEERLGALIIAAGWRELPKHEGEQDRYYAPPTGKLAQSRVGEGRENKDQVETQPRLVLSGRFGELLAASDVVVGLAGTANEQAVGLGKPVVSFPADPSRAATEILDAQARLLGRSLRPVFSRDPQEIALAVKEMLNISQEEKQALAADGRMHMGEGPGAAERIARIIAAGS